MAGLFYSARFAEVATGTTNPLTFIQLTSATNERIKATEASVSFQGTSNTDEPFEIQLLRQTDAGTGGTAVTPRADDDLNTIVAQTTAKAGSFTVEPTAGNILRNWEIHPQQGIVYQFSFEGGVYATNGGRIALRVVSPTQSVIGTGYILFEE